MAAGGAGLAGALALAMVAGFALRAAGTADGREAGRDGFRVLAFAAAAMLGFGLLGQGLLHPADWIIALPDRGDSATRGLLGLPGAGPAGGVADLALAGVAAAAVAAALGRRIRDLPGLAAMAILGGLVLPVVGSWTLGGGFLAGSGFRDLAGATVVYALSGWTALTGLLVLGRRGRKMAPETPEVPGVGQGLVLAGTALLWLGGAGSLAVAGLDRAIGSGLLAGAAGLLAGHLVGRLWPRASGLWLSNGLLAGLVAISANPPAPTPALAAAIGAGAVPVALLLHGLLRRLGDRSGLASVLLGAGTFGTLAAALSDPAATLAGQIHGIALTGSAAATASLAVWVILDGLLGLAADTGGEEVDADPADPPALSRVLPADRD